MNGKKTFGYLAICADRRFWKKTVAAFEEITGLSADKEEYWIEAHAGGTPGLPDTTTSDYAYQHGAYKMGWAAHGDSCGGFPGVANYEIRQKLNKEIAEKKARYPKASHFGFFATGEGVESWND